MCGFALAVGGERTTETLADTLARVEAALARRGPDVTTRHVEPGLVAVSTRLVHWEEGVTDQPRLTENGGFAVFNGELFNLPELQRVLGRPGASEIEVFLAGVQAEGPEFARRIDGQFAAVIRASANAPVLAVRDRFGVSPLYLHRRDGVTYLASALEALEALACPAETEPASTDTAAADAAPGPAPIGGVLGAEETTVPAAVGEPAAEASHLSPAPGPAGAVPARQAVTGLGLTLGGTDTAGPAASVPGACFERDLEGLACVLHDWAPTRGRTVFRDVRQVPPGQVVEIRPDAGPNEPPVVRPWADPRAAAVTGGLGAAATAVTPPNRPLDASPLTDSDLAEFENLMRESVRARMRSVSEIVALISGGIDSTIIAALAHDEGARTGLALYLEGDHVVQGRQRQVASAIGYHLVHHELRPREAVSLLEEYVRTRRVPLVRLGPVGMMSLARRARAEGIRGVISGEGADELFSGYDSYRILAGRAGAFGDPRSLPWEEFGEPEFGGDRGPRWARSYWRAVIALSAGAGNRRADIMRPVAELFRPELREAFDQAAELPPNFGLEDRRQADLRDLLGSYLLVVQGDHAWSEEGVELRPPYLATPVARYALRRDPASFVSISNGKLPVRALLQRLAATRPQLAGLGFAKSAFRVDASFVLRDPKATDHLRHLVSACPDDVLDAAATLARFDKAVAAGTCSESESMLFLLAASLAVLSGQSPLVGVH